MPLVLCTTGLTPPVVMCADCKEWLESAAWASSSISTMLGKGKRDCYSPPLQEIWMKWDWTRIQVNPTVKKKKWRRFPSFFSHSTAPHWCRLITRRTTPMSQMIAEAVHRWMKLARLRPKSPTRLRDVRRESARAVERIEACQGGHAATLRGRHCETG